MEGFIQKFEVQKGRTVTCLQGTVHAGGKLTLASFSGPDDEVKKEKIVAIVKSKAMLPVPLTDAEKEALAKMDKETTARLEREAAEKEAAEARSEVILEADFDEMNKDPMIQFAEDHGIELKATLAEDIRDELKALQESLTAP